MTLTQLRKEFEAEQKIFQRRMQEALERAMEEFWEKFPKVETVSWTQYTPYFNDGDVCEFGVNTDYIKVNDQEEDWGKKDDFSEARSRMTGILTAVGEDILQVIYGDHAEVTLNRSGKTSVKSYEHD